MLETREAVERIVEQAPILEQFEVSEFVHEETDKAGLEFKKPFSEMDTEGEESVTEKFEINEQAVASTLNCEAEKSITTEAYYVRFIFEEWEFQ